MNCKTIAAISLHNRDYPNLDAKLEEAARWVRFAAAQGADLAVLPEALNHYRGDGFGNRTFGETDSQSSLQQVNFSP
ncbi:MAG TPA: hypothetical protein VNQ90_13060 [Chthoniobacteraceae bacterium]|nr:hypothetical protein [Chthoniobacteraceae bacterium]